MARVLMLSALLVSIVLAGQAFDNVIDRHNYGFILVKRHNFYMSTTMGKMVYHYAMPPYMSQVAMAPLNCTFQVNGTMISPQLQFFCRQTIKVISAVRTMQYKIRRHVRERLTDVYDLMSQFRVSPVKRSFFTDAISHITGLATREQISDVSHLLQKLEQGIMTAADAWRDGSKNYMAAFRVEKRRVDNIFDVIRLQRQSIAEVQQQIAADLRFEAYRANLSMTVMNQITATMFQLSEIDNFYNSLQMLAAGRLPHFFLHHSELRRSFRFMNQFLRTDHPDLSIPIVHYRYYYKHASFNAFRYRRFLIIILDVPLTVEALRQAFNLYAITKVPMIAAHSDSHYSELAVQFEAIAFNRDNDYYAIIRKMSDVSLDLVWDLRVVGITLFSRSRPTCGRALIDGNLADIKQFCRYNVYKTPLPRGIYKLADDAVLLSNVSSLTIHCVNNTFFLYPIHDVQIVYQLHCACHFEADEVFIPRSLVER